jgi:hypothetical protein
MPFVKLDSGLLNSTLWFDKTARDVFITALLMAVPHEIVEDEPQIHVDRLDPTGWMVPAGWYGLVESAAVGILSKALVANHAEGLEALRRLGAPDPESRSVEFEGRRMARVDGGYLVLNFQKYRERDYGAADRMRRLRAHRKGKTPPEKSQKTPPVNDRDLGNTHGAQNGVERPAAGLPIDAIPVLNAALQAFGRSDVRPNRRNVPPNVTQAEAEEEKYISGATHPHPPAGGSKGAKKPKPETKHERFAEFWELWPRNDRKHDKAKCCQFWAKHDLDAVADKILADVRGKLGSDKWKRDDGQYIEAPMVYLNGRRWEDGAEYSVNGKPWYDTGPGIEQKGVELGIGKWDRATFEGSGGLRGEPWVTYAKRVFAKAGLTQKS